MPDNVFAVEDELEEQPLEETQAQVATSEPEAGTGGNEAEGDDDLFSFLDNDAGPDEEAPVEEAEETEAAPEATLPPVPAATPFDKLTEQFATFLERQNTPAPVAAPAPPVWVPPFERPEIIQKMAELEEQAIFSPDAARELRLLERKALQEENTYNTNLALAAQRDQLLGINALTTVRDSAYNALKSTASYVDRASFDAAEAEFIQDVFAGDQASYAAMAKNPQIRKQIANNAKVLAIETRAKTQAKPTAKPTTTARAAAPTTQTKPAPRSTGTGRDWASIDKRFAEDPDFEQNISTQAFLGKKRNK